MAYQMGVSRAYVTQVLSLLGLSPEAKDAALKLGDLIAGKGLGIHTLRSIATLSTEKQVGWIEASTAGGS